MARNSEKERARSMLARTMPFSRWVEERQRTPEDISFARMVFNEIVKVADLAPDEECAVRAKLGWEANCGTA